jgi:taurine dioxygenase
MLNVNRNWTVEIVELNKAESDNLLAYCYDHLASPEWQVRYRWNEGDLAFWDNRAVQHYAVADYTTRRMMRRVTITGDRPYGVDDPSYKA